MKNEQKKNEKKKNAKKDTEKKKKKQKKRKKSIVPEGTKQSQKWYIIFCGNISKKEFLSFDKKKFKFKSS